MAEAAPDFEVRVSVTSSDVWVTVSGELDLATCPQLARSLDGVVDVEPRDVVADLSGVTFLDSTALTVLVALRQKLDANDRRLVLHEPSAVVVRVLTLAGLLDTFAVPPTAP